MKRTYMRPSAVVIKINIQLMQFSSGSTDTTKVDPNNSVDPNNAMSREESGFSLWDDE